MSWPRLLVIASAIGACTPYDPTLGDTPFLCGTTEPKCPEGYTCKMTPSGASVCTNTDPMMPPPPGSCTMPFTGVLGTWSFAGQPGTQASTAAASSAPGVMASGISRAPALMAAAGTGSISAGNWPTGSQLDSQSYFTLALTGPSGCTLEVSTLAIDAKSSTTGPASAAVGTSADAFAHTVAVSTSAPSMPSLAVMSTTGNLEIRIYGFAATATGGTLRIQNMLSVSGVLR